MYDAKSRPERGSSAFLMSNLFLAFVLGCSVSAWADEATSTKHAILGTHTRTGITSTHFLEPSALSLSDLSHIMVSIKNPVIAKVRIKDMTKHTYGRVLCCQIITKLMIIEIIYGESQPISSINVSFFTSEWYETKYPLTFEQQKNEYIVVIYDSNELSGPFSNLKSLVRFEISKQEYQKWHSDSKMLNNSQQN